MTKTHPAEDVAPGSGGRSPSDEEIVRFIRTIPDHPKPGILFRDISTLIGDREGLRLAVKGLCNAFPDCRPDKVAGIEARGFILGGAVASYLRAGFVPLRKKGKLPAETVEISYDLEYGTESMEIHRDAIEPGERVLLVDDLIATGGTALAGIELLRGLGAEVIGLVSVIDLPALGGSEKIRSYGISVVTLCEFEGD